MTSPRHRQGARAQPSPALRGEIGAPGDKSVSHRALILAAMAAGETVISGLLAGDDVLRTAAALRALGARIEREGADWRVAGGAWRAPERTLYLGNSGTGCRLLMGAVAGRGVAAAFDGDASLRRRPMGRALAPLAAMGAQIEARADCLPVRLAGGRLVALDYALPVPSAQVKSAILLAALGAEGETVVRESAPTRDHTERLLAAFGAQISTEAAAGGRIIRLRGGQRLSPANLTVPGDPSSAAFLVAAALIVPGSDVLVRGVLVNPLRTGFYQTAREMGADIVFENPRVEAGEPVADIRARFSRLKGVAVPAARAPSMIDEYPILAVLAAFAEGETRMEGLAELRLKESDRLAAAAAGFAANGVACEAGDDRLVIRGGAVAGGGLVETHLDHRIAMSFLVLGLASEAPVAIDDTAMIATSFPGFFSTLTGLGAKLESPI